MHIMQLWAWNFNGIIISKLKVCSLKSSSNCWWINITLSFLWSIISLMSCLVWNSFFTKNKMSFSNVFIWSFWGRINWKLFVCCIVHWNKMSTIFAHFKVMSSHSCLSIQLCLSFLLRHICWLSLIMNSMRSVIVLRMISKPKMRFSQIFFRLNIKT